MVQPSCLPGDTSGRGPAFSVTDLFEAEVLRTPDAPAVVAGEESLSYRELDRRANQLAWHLQHLGVATDIPVAVLLERSIEMTIGVVAVLKAGGACLPIDPRVPPDRVAYLLGDSRAPVILTQQRFRDQVGRHRAIPVWLDEVGPDFGGSEGAPPRSTAPGDLGYVIYTSGSAGAPKGVMLTHQGLANHHLAVAQLYQLAPGDRVLQFCSPSFDVSIEEMFPTWSVGATVVLRDDHQPILSRSWLEWLRRQGITVLNLPTAYWHEWVRDLQRLGGALPDMVRLVTVGGEKAPGQAWHAFRRIAGEGTRCINAYGPTEATIMATWFEADGDGTGCEAWVDPPIGRPLANTEAWVVDDAGRPVDLGTAGELYLAGPGIARGYLNRPELTEERFLVDPFGYRPGSRFYRTGDQVRGRPDGNLEFVGRLDQQVKVRGFRIECAEIEAALLAHPDVADAAVVAREDTPGQRRLVGYVVADGPGSVTDRELRRFLCERLPAFMVPSAFVVLHAFPISATGKVDRDALPPPERPRYGARDAPSDPIEDVLAAIWSEVLCVDALGVDEDFFDLGGHSLLATQLISQVRESFGVELPVAAIFEAATVRALARTVEAARMGAGESSTEEPPATGSAAPGNHGEAAAARPGRGSAAGGEGSARSPAQEQMSRLEAEASPPGLYNITALHRFSQPINLAALRRALCSMAERHDALRTSFATDKGAVFQTVGDSATVELAVTDLTATGKKKAHADLHRLVAAQDAEPFDVSRPPLMRCHLYRLGDDESVFAATFDHLVCDGTSAYIFLTELTETYAAMERAETPALRPIRRQYRDFTVWQRQWLTEERRQAQLEYWKQALAGMPLGPAVPFDRVPSGPSRRIASRPLSVPPECYRDLRGLARAAQATVFVVLVAALDVVLSAAGGATDVVLSTTLSGRQRAEWDGVIGCFANVGRVRTDLSGASTFTDVVLRARGSVLGLFQHQDIPFLQVREALLPSFRATWPSGWRRGSPPRANRGRQPARSTGRSGPGGSIGEVSQSGLRRRNPPLRWRLGRRRRRLTRRCPWCAPPLPASAAASIGGQSLAKAKRWRTSRRRLSR